MYDLTIKLYTYDLQKSQNKQYSELALRKRKLQFHLNSIY